MECVILIRNPNNGRVTFIGCSDDEDGMKIFRNLDEAVSFARASPLCDAWPYQIVGLNEL